MITIKIEKHKEPDKYVYTPPKTTTMPNTSFDEEELKKARELSISLGIVEGLVMKHEPTGHIVTVTGWVDKNKITHYKGNPCIIKALRDRQGYQWETVYSVDELMQQEYKTVYDDQPGVTA
jgi:hypothetical protein